MTIGHWAKPINALYLTPISGSLNKLSEILKGEYKEWAAVILRSIDTAKVSAALGDAAWSGQ